ncbi:hypothetical protein EHI44_18590 [Rhizobium leguminosarum]|uniref:hypothetical protein n=1 Tax=Rhizobium leguminosarum TaxID=384 RepID=UPI00027D8942|nr:hypothetical protein [Rhizobium leguminosarum]RWY84659.1 hypothetical protein EHI44_18590 [Rhizobium leguminosarum]
MSIFSDKLETLSRTIEANSHAGQTQLVDALRDGLTGPAIAVGSGGSAVSASYFACCRRTLKASQTAVQTPMEFVLNDDALTATAIWLFSASGDNADIVAALDSALVRQASVIHIVTSKRDGLLGVVASKHARVVIHLIPVMEAKDGFLATHTLVGVITALLVASDQTLPTTLGTLVAESFAAAAEQALSRASREEIRARLDAFGVPDTLILLEDPRLAPVGITIETSLWEVGLCAVQRTDFRNFAHGRHVWLKDKLERSLLFVTAGRETLPVWSDIKEALPDQTNSLLLAFDNCGRFDNAVGILRAMAFISALGDVCGVDPGKPGVAPFSRPIYEARSLLSVSSDRSPAVRHKQRAIDFRDDPLQRHSDTALFFKKAMTRFENDRFAGIVLDYDGTLVTFEGRFQPPSAEICSELVRLLDAGIAIGIATGRGGSVGEDLRPSIPEKYHDRILIGYYNGAYLRPLAIDISLAPPNRDPRIENAARWMASHGDMLGEKGVRNSGQQISIDLKTIKDVAEFKRAFNQSDMAEGLRLAQSAHTLDVCLVETCKTSVVSALFGEATQNERNVICIGDSGDLLGNDHVLLGTRYGISVDQVCDRGDVCWALLGSQMTGPDALLILLRSIVPEGLGQARFAIPDPLRGQL